MPHLDSPMQNWQRPDWQMIVVVAILAAAAIYIVRRSLMMFHSSREHASGPGSCGSCGSCGSGEKPSGNATAGFVPLENLTSNKPRPAVRF